MLHFCRSPSLHVSLEKYGGCYSCGFKLYSVHNHNSQINMNIPNAKLLWDGNNLHCDNWKKRFSGMW